MLKKMWICLFLCMFLCGCAQQPVFETLGDVEHLIGERPAMGTMTVQLPQEAAAQTLGTGDGTMYDCEGYTLVMHTTSAGDFSKTVQQLSGFTPENLTIMETQMGENKRYEWVWTAATEDGDVLCRAAVLDDGTYHYCMSAMAQADLAGQLTTQWNALFASFCLGQ